MIRPLLFAIAILSSVSLAAQNWPEFRGPNGDGHADSKNLPIKWSESESVRWKTPIHGRAWSSPVIQDGQIWLTTATPDGHQLFGVCVDAPTGKIVHDLKLFDVAVPQFRHDFNSYASPTPALETGRAYVTFGSPGTACLDTKTGTVLWQRTDFVCNHFRGAGSSPIIYNDLLIMNFDGSDYQYMVALDKKTGKTVWRADRSVNYDDIDKKTGKPTADGDFRKAFSTPHVFVIDGVPTLISSGAKASYAYDPDTGKELWHIEHRANHSAANRPLYSPKLNLIYFAAGFSKGEVFAVRPGGSGDVTKTHIAWSTKRNAPNKPSMILADDLLFMCDDGGIASCLDAKTGQDVWRQRIGGNYSASPLYADGKVYFFSEDGKTTVIAAGREFKVLAENHLDDGFMSSPAVTGDSLILRTKTALYRIDPK